MGGSISFGKIFEGLVAQSAEVGGYLWQKGWAEGNAGNLSINVTEHVPTNLPVGLFPFVERPLGVAGLAKQCFLITGTGTRFRDVARDPERFMAVVLLSKDPEGYYVVWGGKGKDPIQVTSELVSHLMIHKMLIDLGRREDTVLHAHPDELVAMTHLPGFETSDALNQALWKMLPEIKMFGGAGVSRVSYQMPGTPALGEETVKGLGNGRKVVLWEKHGALAVGRGPRSAFDNIDLFNKASILYLKCKASGFVPTGLSDQQVADLAKAYPTQA